MNILVAHLLYFCTQNSTLCLNSVRFTVNVIMKNINIIFVLLYNL